ncbi:DUF2877 domain-containing protein [Streptomyces sp. NPDC020792]|uniref:oxamate carbamoyltransferase subunit AllH family protein n=1 Tax=Streptomyces sp. NPDC020792 TaxID=3365089 RepID=UPI00378A44B4
MSPTALPGLVSEPARDVLAGPARPARVIAVARQALYLLPHGQRDPLALVVPGAVRVAAAVVLPGAAGDRPFHGLTPGRTGRVGAGRIAIGSLCLTAGEFWAPPRAQDTPPGPGTRPARHAPPAPAAAARGPPRRPCSRALLAHGGPAARGPRPARPRRDTLRGRLHVRAAARRPGAAAPAGLALALAHIAAEADRLTPPVSAALLRQAAEGLCIPQVAALLRAAATGGDPSGPVTALLAGGHSSGCDLLHGRCAGARLATRARDGVRPRSTPS